MNHCLLILMRALLRVLSLLPGAVHYALSDCLLFPLLFHVLRYRRSLVRRQLADSFPHLSPGQIRHTERRFYHFLCDIVVEYVMLARIPATEMMRRVEFVGIREAILEAQRRGKQFCFFCPGHYANWEWLSSYALWMPPGWRASQLYHPLHNEPVNELLRSLRSQYGGECVPMRDTLRHILGARARGQMQCVAFISDQSPTWEAMHHWTTFLHHPSSFFTGAERIARQVDAAVFYVHTTRLGRGRYQARIIPLTWDARSEPEHAVTNAYARHLEEQICHTPELWLWTHNRWKRTREQWEERQALQGRQQQKQS